MRTWLCLIVVAAIACGGKKDDPGPSVASGSEPPAPVAGEVQIFINDALVGKIAPAQVAAWPRLVTLLPMSARRLGQWQSISLTTGKAKPTELNRPSMTYPDTVPTLFPGEGGATSFGMFDSVDLAKHGTPKVREDNLREIRIKTSNDSSRGQNETGDGAGADPATIKLMIKTTAGEHVMDGKTLLAMTLKPMPGNEDSHGWTLTTILDAAGIKAYERLLLTDVGGTNVTIDKKDFDDVTAIPFVKLNRQGALRFTVLKKQGEGWQKTADLRGLASIEVVK